MFVRSVSLAETAFGKDSVQVAKTLRELADCLVAQKKFAGRGATSEQSVRNRQKTMWR